MDEKYEILPVFGYMMAQGIVGAGHYSTFYRY
jgi:hypothetical protein